MSKKAESSPRLRGKVLSLNISPKGHIEGVMIETEAGLVQLNFPKHDFEALAQSMPVGSEVDLRAKLETDRGDHPVYKAGSEESEACGAIARLNYSLHGDVNGYHLDDGTFLHVFPQGAKRYKLRIGDEVRATGARHLGSDATVLEARAVERLARLGEDSARA